MGAAFKTIVEEDEDDEDDDDEEDDFYYQVHIMQTYNIFCLFLQNENCLQFNNPLHSSFSI